MAFSLLLIFAFLAFTVDVMRQFLLSQQIKFAANASALDLLPFACLDANGQIQNAPVCSSSNGFTTTALANLTAELERQSSSEAWNESTSNQESENWKEAVTFTSDDMSASANPNDIQDPILRLQISRSGQSALHMLFLPVIFSFNAAAGMPVPESAANAEQTHIVEVIGQPAARIGAGVPIGGGSGKASAMSVARAAGFPLAINYDDFKRLLAANGSTAGSCTVHLCSPQQSQYQASSELRAYFVNLAAGTQVSDYYGAAQTSSDLNDLVATLLYFDNSPSQPVSQSAKEPAALERGVQLDRFAASTAKNSTDMATVVSQLSLNKCYILPVVREGILPSSQCQVLGFALLKLNSVTPTSAGWDFAFSTGESLPVLNASCSPALKTIPSLDGSLLPDLYDAQSSPFKARSYDITSNSIAARPMSVVLAPVVSPRRTESYQ